MKSALMWALALSLTAVAAGQGTASASQPLRAPATSTRAVNAAQAGLPRLPPGSVIARAPLTVNCLALPHSQHRYAVAHGICPPERTGTIRDSVSVTTGTCGSSWIAVLPSGLVDYGFNSTKGNVVHRSLTIFVTDGDNSQMFDDNGLMFSTSYSASIVGFSAQVNATVTATMNGSVAIASPTIACTVGPVFTSQVV